MKNCKTSTSISFMLWICVSRFVFLFFRFHVSPRRFVFNFFSAKGLLLIIFCVWWHFTPYYSFLCFLLWSPPFRIVLGPPERPGLTGINPTPICAPMRYAFGVYYSRFFFLFFFVLLLFFFFTFSLRKVSGLYRTSQTKTILSKYIYMFVITLPHFSGYTARSRSSRPLIQYPWVFHFYLWWKGLGYG
jgi:hypothetical protein